MMEQNQTLYPNNIQPQLEDILADPDAKWSDIRNAIKAHGRYACTNAAVICALSHSMKPVLSHPSSMKQAVSAQNNVGDSSNELHGNIMPMLVAVNGTQSSNKPIRRQSRRTSILASVNIMDFGVDNFVDLDQSTRSKQPYYPRRESELTCDSDGFMGWKRAYDDSSVMYDTEDFSRHFDSEGPHMETPEECPDSDANVEDLNCDPKEVLAQELSPDTSQNNDLENKDKMSKNREETDCSEPTVSSKPLNLFAAMRRLSSIGSRSKLSPTRSPPGQVETVELDEVRQALINLRANASSQRFILPDDVSVQKPSHDSSNTKPLTATIKDQEGNIPLSRRQTHSGENVRKSRPVSIWDSVNNDTREAIRINRKDGGVDIEKESRKLYVDHEDPGMTSPPMTGFFLGEGL